MTRRWLRHSGLRGRLHPGRHRQRQETKVNLPQGCATGALWSADGSHFAFQNAVDTSVQLWVGDAATGQVKQSAERAAEPDLRLHRAVAGRQQNLLVKLVPANQGPAPSNGGVPTGPDAQESLGSSGESSTYEARDTLTSVHDEKLFAYGASQLAVVDTAAGSVRPVGQPALFNDVSAAPDGVHVLTESIKAPYSHAVTYQRFANDVAVLDISSGRSTPIASLPLADRVPVHGVPEGPRVSTGAPPIRPPWSTPKRWTRATGRSTCRIAIAC
jgi:dipeptidyl aminopeptidase/acylaminoacyl peptidase